MDRDNMRQGIKVRVETSLESAARPEKVQAMIEDN